MSDRSPAARVATALGCTEGQAYTLVIGVVVTVITVWIGIPPTLRDRVTSVRSIASERSDEAPIVPATPEPRSDRDGPRAPLAPVPPEPMPPPGVSSPNGASDTDPPPATPRRPTAPASPARSFGVTRIAARVGQPGAPDGVAIDSQGRTHVATNNGLGRGGEGRSRIFRYASDGNLDGEVVVTGQAETRTSGLTGLVLDADGFVFALDTAPARVLRADLGTGDQATYEQIPDLAACGLVSSSDTCEPGAHDERPLPRGIALDGRGNLFVTDSNQELIWRIAPTGTVQPWAVFAEGEVPAGVAIDNEGDVVVVLSRSGDSGPAAGAVIHVDVRSDGTAGRRTMFAETEPLAGPVGLAVTSTGEVVVALADADAVMLLGRDGKELDRLDAAGAEGDSGKALDTPTGVFVAGGRAFVTNQAPSDSSAWVVFSIELNP